MKITLEYYDHTCGDGCCYTTGYDVFVDGKKIGQTIGEDAQELADLLNETFNAKREMNYKEAIEKSLTVKWKVDTCDEGERCWCRVIKCEEPIFFKEEDNADDEEYYVIGSGELNKETAEHIVKIHNETFNTKEK